DSTLREAGDLQLLAGLRVHPHTLAHDEADTAAGPLPLVADEAVPRDAPRGGEVGRVRRGGDAVAREHRAHLERLPDLHLSSPGPSRRSAAARRSSPPAPSTRGTRSRPPSAPMR